MGFGMQSIALSRIASRVVGLHIEPAHLERAQRNAVLAGSNGNIRFTDQMPAEKFDVVLFAELDGTFHRT